jgi:Ca2+-binding EF-hand superfamily protein
MELTPPSGFGAEADLFTIEITDQDRREAERAFGYYDRNRDRKIDSEEMRRSRYGSDLPLFDRNRDGYITLNEMEYRYAQRRANNEGGNSTASSRRDSGKSSDKDEPEARWREKRDDDRKSYRAQAATESAQEGLPDWFASDDADADGQVAMAEYSVTWSDSVMSDFSQFDLNQDGMITPQECLKAVENGAVRGGSVDATSADSSSSDSGSSSSDSKSSSAEADSSSSGPSSGASTASSRPSPAPATSLKISPQYMKYYQSLVAKYDKNGDKTLVRDEWVSMSKDPAAADVDGNGRITVEEYASWSMKKQ